MQQKLLPTTIAGSLPKPAWLAIPRKLWSPWKLEGKDVLVGAIDVSTDTVETPEEVASTIRKALHYVTPERLYPCTNCGMVPLARHVALGKMKALAAGAAIVRAELSSS